jgi:enoyl-CoA hydratase
MNYEDFKHLEFERLDDSIVIIHINRPDVLNATNAVLHRELKEVWLTVGSDPTAKVALITGRGKAFSAGGDFELLDSIANSYDTVLKVMDEARQIVENMINLDKPIVSAINGVAVGAGLAVALSADISIVGENVTLIDGHLKFGVTAGDHACLIWPMYISISKAKYYLLTGDKLNGIEAERIGLVSKCVKDGSVFDEAITIAQKLNKGNESAIKFTKRSLNHYFRTNWPIFESSLALEMLNFLSDDTRKSISEFKAK